MTCTEDGCDQRAKAHGLCPKHYMRQRARLPAKARPVRVPVQQGTAAERELRDRVRAVLDAAEPFDVGPEVRD